ncbi:hypothetical protein PR048_029798 [Dryococelus australis]|uniref:Uncharacterized protein n=1 Tax=Dryococelus australis TaxID=614101 RepID=A0ABQ9G761_9NEOP|nr:hypothetical protein PR048_029798 [Dryococelus australis]
MYPAYSNDILSRLSEEILWYIRKINHSSDFSLSRAIVQRVNWKPFQEAMAEMKRQGQHNDNERRHADMPSTSLGAAIFRVHRRTATRSDVTNARVAACRRRTSIQLPPEDGPQEGVPLPPTRDLCTAAFGYIQERLGSFPRQEFSAGTVIPPGRKNNRVSVSMWTAGERNEVSQVLESLHYGSADNVQPHGILASSTNAKLFKFGAFNTLFDKPREYDAKYMNFYRMPRETFDKLLALLYDHLKHEDNNVRNCISPPEMLAVILRYLATGNTFTELHYSFRLEIKTVRRIVRVVCKKIWMTSRGAYMSAPTTTHQFDVMANFPNCVGAVDSKYTRIMKPQDSGSMFYN